MNKSKLEELLGQLDEQKFRHFGDFVLSKYHNKNKQIIKLYDYFRKINRKVASFKITKPEVHSRLFPGKNFNRQRIELLLSEFKSLLVDFILSEELKSGYPAIKNDLLLNLFNSGSLTKNYESTLNEIRKLSKLDLNRTYKYYFYKFNAEFNNANLNILNIVYSKDKNILQLLENNANFLFIELKLELLILILRHLKEHGKDLEYKVWQKENIIKYIMSNLDLIKKEHPVIFTLYMIIRLYTAKKTDAYYTELKLYLKENFSKFRPEIIRDLFTELIIYNDDRLGLDRAKHSKEMFEIYTTLEESKVYEKLDMVDPFDFMNAIYLGLEQKQKTWVVLFFNKYKDKIDPALKSDLIRLTNASIIFEDGHYSEALTELNYVESNEFYFYLRIRLLRAKIYYEINDIEASKYIIDSLKHYIKRHKEKLGVTFEAMNYFIYYYNVLLKFKEKKDTKRIKQILKELKAQHKIVSKVWLVNQFEKHLINNAKISGR